jgi:two-component system phosphate regulon sensor histidine kinase PhoR
MREKIFHNFILLSIGSIILTLVVAVGLMYRSVAKQVQDDLRQDVIYLVQGLAADKDFLQKLPGAGSLTRITLVDPTGKVLYDNMENPALLENHLQREEVQAALKAGQGSVVRHSDTLNKDVYYYAVKMQNGSILRVARTADTVLQTVYGLLPYLILAAVVLGILAYLLAKRLTGKLVEPLQEIDLDKPLEGDAYDELEPFLTRINKQNKELKEAANLRREFTANVSHELKTPLQSISGYAEIINNGIAKPEDVPRFVGKISDESKRLIHMVDNIMKLSRLDEKASADLQEEVDLTALVRQCAEGLQSKAEASQVLLAMNLPTACPYQGIKHVLEEIIFNLLENAIKYNKVGGSVKVKLTAGPHPVLQVADTGIGIAPEDKERIFERFYRSDKSHATIVPGNGLGLSIVKHGAIASWLYHSGRALL